MGVLKDFFPTISTTQGPLRILRGATASACSDALKRTSVDKLRLLGERDEGKRQRDKDKAIS